MAPNEFGWTWKFLSVRATGLGLTLAGSLAAYGVVRTMGWVLPLIGAFLLALADQLNVSRLLRGLRPNRSRRQLKDRGLLSFHKVRQQHDLAVRKFEGVMMGVLVI